ncbi:MAG TPA: BsuPI-related putative proteinase inhibitor [Gemmatimonadaceae bacterium]|nr:BsuPI-related putative proteinase inhibitor [Gemmatimonadaceae bacterium]
MTEPPPQLRISLTAPESVPLGSKVPIVIRLENAGETALELYLRGRTIAYDILIEDATGEVVWRRLEGEIIPGIIQIKVLDSGEVLELSHDWDQRTNRGDLVEPGSYTVRGSVLTDSPEPMVSPTKPLLVVSER